MRHDPKRLHRQRAQLDARIKKLRPAIDQVAPPPRGGWLRAVRQSLGMSAAQLGVRMGIRKQSVLQLERNELSGKLTLESLQRAAGAMGCRLAYALVPQQSLEAQIDERARSAARRRLGRVSHSMTLEDQSLATDLHDLQVAETAREIKEKLGAELWNEP